MKSLINVTLSVNFATIQNTFLPSRYVSAKKKNVFENSESDLQISENIFEFLVRKIRKQKAHLEQSEPVRENLYKEETRIDGTGRVSNKHSHQIFTMQPSESCLPVCLPSSCKYV